MSRSGQRAAAGKPKRSEGAMRPLAAALFSAGCTSLVWVAPVAAQQQQAPATLEEIVVTSSDLVADQTSSRKATTTLENTPQTITVIKEKVFKEQGARSLADVLNNTPGITYDGGENGFSTGSSNFKMRGFESGSNIFVDGVRDSGNYNRDVYNLESVEVVKGSAGDNGRGGPGGYVNLVTKTAKFQDAYQGSLTYGFDRYDSSARKRATVDLNKVLNESVAARLNMMVEGGGVAGRDLARARAWGIAPSVTFKLAPGTTANLSYSHLQTNDRPEFGVPTAVVPGFTPSGANDPLHGDLPGLSRDKFYGHVSDYDKVKQDTLSARINHDISSATSIENLTRYSRTDRKAIYTVIGSVNKNTGVVTPSRQGFDRINTTLTNQTNLRTRFQTGSLRHTLSTGVELTREESDSGREFTLASPGPTDVYNPNPHRPLGGPDSGPLHRDDVRINTIAAYVYDTIEFNPRWQVTGGVRLEHYKSRIGSTDANYPANNYKRSDTTLNGSLGVVFKPNSDGSIYANVGLSTLPPGSFLSHPDISRGGANSFPTLSGQNNPDAKVQRALHYELGTKWQFFDKKLLTTAALFRTERRNVAMTDGTDLLGYGKQQVQGIELSAAGYITPQWGIFGGVVFQDSKRTHGSHIDAALSAARPADYGGALSTSGDQLAFTPRTQANLWTTYRLPIGLTLGAGMRYMGSSYVGRPDNVDRVIKNGVNGKMPSYLVFNAMAAYEVNKNVTVRLNIDNITDKTYATSANWSARRIQLGAPRTFMLSADILF